MMTPSWEMMTIDLSDSSRSGWRRRRYARSWGVFIDSAVSYTPR
jgi:hypothetical protein